jgi:hypothetical protein
VPDKQASAWTQRKKRFLLKDEVDFKPQSTAQLMKWQPWEGSAKFEARCGHTATVLANQTQALIFGGGDENHHLMPQTVQVFDCITNSFRHLTVTGSAPKRRVGHTATLDWSGNRIVIIGGSFSHGERASSVDVLHGVRLEESGEKLYWNNRHNAQWHLPNEKVAHIEAEYTRKDWCGCQPRDFPGDNYQGMVIVGTEEVYLFPSSLS